MTNPKPLKEIKLQTALADKQSKYLTNLELGKAIKVPVAVLKVIHKMNTSIVLSDILAHALLLRAASTKDEVRIRNWMEFPDFPFPQTQANIQFSKFLRTVFSGTEHHITENELELAIHFFAKCPHGYMIPEDLVCSHSELKATST
ncbi:hypothetical protein [Paenibacillus silvae]|uniref:Uncharacterized protein n=1 Tax=Paenibacillus silvae TaxID=1325358 RepID=A0A2W6NNI4_9BACL|nr:hypothetical protein [Paenibacillus silvae]PZT57407.1 hypothetical protein DN757_01755 [Paenibacillus silvae]